jgi:hypothetical protein
LLYGYSDSYPWVSLVEILVGIAGLAVVVVAWGCEGDQFPRWFTYGSLFVSVVAFLTWCWIQIRVAPAYGTDEAAFDQYAAQLAAHGHNPYAASMVHSFSLFHVSPNGFTFRLNGLPVTRLSYPALSFLFYVPFVWIGWTSQLAIWINVVAWVIAIIVAFRLLPSTVKPLAIVLGSLGIYTGFAVGGVTDALYVPFLIVAVYKWDAYRTRTGWRRWIAPAAMGIAMAIKQTPWFVLPFVILAIYLDAKHNEAESKQPWRHSLEYLWRTLLVFLIPNLVFLVVNPSAWFRGVLTPIFGDAVPAGQGWIAFSNFLGIGGGSLHIYTVLSLLVFALSLVLFVMLYPRTKAITVLMASLVLFFSERSFANYLTMLLLPTLVAACSIASLESDDLSLPSRLWGSRTRRVALSVSGGGALLALVGATFVHQPISIQIESVTTTGQLATVVDVTAYVTNNTGARVRPIFTSESGGAITAPWNVTNGPLELGPNQSATYVVEAPNFFAQPSLSGGFQLAALTRSPAAMSVSSPYTPTTWHVNLNPEAVNHPVSVGETTTFVAQVLNATNSPVKKAGIPVYLGQISYTQHGLVFSSAVINQGNVGQTPVEALTNADGEATFNVTGTQASSDPVYFEANLINSQASYPYGYSDIVPIQYQLGSRIGN